MEEFNLHQINPEIQQFYYCFNTNSQVELDQLLTDLIDICNNLFVNQNLTIKLENYADNLDKKWNKGPKRLPPLPTT